MLHNTLFWQQPSSFSVNGQCLRPHDEGATFDMLCGKAVLISLPILGRVSVLTLKPHPPFDHAAISSFSMRHCTYRSHGTVCGPSYLRYATKKDTI
jgi:hypothetical protein